MPALFSNAQLSAFGPCAARRPVQISSHALRIQLKDSYRLHPRPATHRCAAQRSSQKPLEQASSESESDASESVGSAPQSGADDLERAQPAEARSREGAQAQAAASASQSVADELQQMRQKVREQEVQPGFVQGIVDETRLIEWPSIKDAVFNTFLVIALVAGTSIFLFLVNSLLAETSKFVYGSH